MSDCEITSVLPSKLRTYAKKNRIPLSATFELTPFCNFTCPMCYIRLTKEQAEKHGKMLSADEWLDVALQARSMGTLYVTLTGGEPLLRPDFWEIYSKLNEFGFLISIMSNGSLVDENAIEKFRKYGMPYQFKLTLYGASNKTYERVCGVADGFTRISNAVKLLKDSKVPLMLTATVVRENADDLQKMYEVAREWNVPFQHSISVVKSARGAKNSVKKSRFTFDEFIDELTLEKLEKNKFPPLDSPFAWCANYGNSFWMTWNGYMQLCAFMNGPYTTLENGLESAWEKLNIKLDSLKSPYECADCKYAEFCQRCPGTLCAESGDSEKTSKEFCKIAERLYAAYQKLIKEE
ncbi:MAG: radical SAM protein [Ruminococcaceae bacterium]|nr:radical SAM protein [Oscillospiraceae bacterium]